MLSWDLVMFQRLGLGNVGRGLPEEGAQPAVLRHPQDRRPLGAQGRLAGGRAASARWIRAFGRDRDGTALVEFTLVLVLLVTIMVGIMQFGLLLNGYITLNSATDAGARTFALARGSSTAYADTRSQIFAAAPNLQQGSLTITLAVNGTTCGSNSACQTALQSAQGLPITVTTSYPCNLLTIISGFTLAATCTLGSSMTQRVE
jgi:Flp pilus assembly protein TadG